MKATQTMNLFSPEECLDIIKMGDALPQVDWEIQPDAHAGTVKLKKTGAAMPMDGKVSWIFEKAIKHLDVDYKIDTLEQLQFGVYKPGDFMDWHLDRGTNEGGYTIGVENNYMVNRICGGIVMLSHPDDYQGGDLQIKMGENIFPTNKARGSMVVLGSDVLHRVTPVIKGVRRTLVIWGLSDDKLSAA